MGEENQNKKGGKKVAFIIVILILILANGGQFYLQWDTNNKHVEVVKGKDAQISSEIARADSLLGEMKLRMAELAQLGADTTEMGEMIRELTVERDNFKRKYNSGWAKVGGLKKEIEAKIQLLNLKDAEIANLNAQVTALDSNNKDLKMTIVEREDTISQLKIKKEELAEKVKIASVLKAEIPVVAYMNAKGKEYTKEPFKGKKIDQLKITFNLGKNNVARRESKDVLLRVQEPEGSTIFDESLGGGSFNYKGKDIKYTAKQSVLFDNTGQTVTFGYKKGNLFKSGQHTVEIYCEDELIGTKKFKVK